LERAARGSLLRFVDERPRFGAARAQHRALECTGRCACGKLCPRRDESLYGEARLA
jgi:hypothetical protein